MHDFVQSSRMTTAAPETPEHAVAAIVRAEMGRQRVSAVDLAQRTGINRASLGRRLAGAVEFKPSQLLAISRELDVDVRELLNPYIRQAAQDINRASAPAGSDTPNLPAGRAHQTST